MLQLPFKGTFPLTQKFNDSRYRSSYTKFGLLGHNGIDYGLPVGTPLYAPHDGDVKETEVMDAGGYGWYIKITNAVEGSVIGHMREQSKLKTGSKVKAGDLIGYSGNTGNSTGPHLHWGYYREPRDRDNGFNGFMDQTYWMNIPETDAYKAKYDDLMGDHKVALTHIKTLIDAVTQIDGIAEKALQ